MAPSKKYVNLEELEGLAKPHLTPEAYGYYSSGAESESSLRDNRAAFARLRLLPRMLRSVESVDTTCELLGACIYVCFEDMIRVRVESDGRMGVADAFSLTVHTYRAPTSHETICRQSQCTKFHACTLAGHRLSMPVIVAPMAMQRLCHPEGELAASRAAHAVGILYTLSTMATSSLEEVAATQLPNL
jgi:hypothetical protein